MTKIYEMGSLRDVRPEMVHRHARLAMASLDQWLADAEHELVGREVVLMRGERRGKIHKIERVAIAAGASGYHMFLSVDGYADLVELGVSCELLGDDA